MTILWVLLAYLCATSTLIALALHRSSKAKETPLAPRPCRHRYTVTHTYQDGQKKCRCEKCGNVRLIHSNNSKQ